MKKGLGYAALAAFAASVESSLDNILPDNDESLVPKKKVTHTTIKAPLTGKQKKARAKSKMAKQSRKKNRK